MTTSPLSLLNASEFTGKSKEKLEKVAEQFVTILVSKIFDEMEKSVVKSSFIPQSTAEQWYRQWLMDLYSQEAAKGSFKSLSDMMVAQLARNSYGK